MKNDSGRSHQSISPRQLDSSTCMGISEAIRAQSHEQYEDSRSRAMTAVERATGRRRVHRLVPTQNTATSISACLHNRIQYTAVIARPWVGSHARRVETNRPDETLQRPQPECTGDLWTGETVDRVHGVISFLRYIRSSICRASGAKENRGDRGTMGPLRVIT